MGKTFARLKSLRLPTLSVLGFLALLIPIGMYFFVYVPLQQTYFARRNIRLLSVLSDQLKAKIETAPKALKNLAGTAAGTNDFTTVKQQIRSSIALYPSLTLVGPPTVATNTISNTNTAVTLEVETEANTSWLKFTYIGIAGTNTNTLVSIAAKSDLNQLVGPQPEFDGVVIAQADGPVIFQRSRAGWKILRLDTLTEKNGRKLETNLAAQASFMADVSLGKTEYKMFLQPLVLSSISNLSKTNQWWVCGLVESDRFREKSWAVSHIYLVWFLFLMLFCVVSLPFFKIKLMGSREKLSKGDVLWLAFASLFGGALTSLLFLHVYTQFQTEETLDDQLLKFSTNIQINVKTELASMYRQLEEFRASGTNDHKEEKYLDNSNWLFLTNVLSKTDILTNFPNNAYPFFLQTVWINKEGDISKRWTVKNKSSAFINLKERFYFQDAMAQRHSLYEFNLSGTNFPAKTKVWVEPILSWGTGEGTVVLSTFDPASNQVIMIESKLLSLINPVVPFGYGYCIAGHDGQVLFHSDSGRSLRENLLTECDNDPRLRYALGGGIDDTFDAKYQGKTYSFYITPLAGSAWSLVVFRNEHIPDSVMFDIFLIASFLFLLHALSLWLVWLFYRWRRRQWLIWLWPAQDGSFRYRRVVAINGVIALLAFLAIACIWEPWQLTFVGAVAGWLGILGFCCCQRLPKTAEPAVETPGKSCWYNWALASLLFLAAALPAYAFFKSAYDVQMELFVKYGQLYLAKGLQERALRVENEYRSIGMGAHTARTNFQNKRLTLVPTNQALDVYDSFFFETHCSDNGHAKPNENIETNIFADFKNFLGNLRRRHYRSGLESFGAFREKAIDSSFHWQSETNSSGIGDLRFPKKLFLGLSSPKKLLLNQGEFREGRLLHISSQIRPLNFLAGPCLGLLLVLGVLYYAVEFMARRVFLVDVGLEPEAALAKYEPLNKASPNLLILHSSRGKNVEIKSLVTSAAIDLQNSSDVELWTNFSVGGEIPQKNGKEKATPEEKKSDVPQPPPTPPQVEFITIDHFEYRCDDSQFNLEKLELVEKLVLDGRTSLVVISTIDPSSFRLPDESPKTTAADKTQDETCPPAQQIVLSLQRWADVFQSFLRIHTEQDEIQLARSQEIPGEAAHAHPPASLESSRALVAAIEPHFWSIWAICSHEERVALYQVAKNCFINRHFPELPGLLQRGLIVRKPHLQLMTPSFEQFVTRVFRQEELIACDLAEKDSSWNKLKGPAKTALLVVALLLLLTQQELFDSVVKIVIAFTGALPKLFDFLNLFNKDASTK